MKPLRLIAEETRNIEGYRAQRHVSLLGILVMEAVDWGSLDDAVAADTLGALGRRAMKVIEGEHDGLLVRWGGGQLVAVFADPTSAVLSARALHDGSLALRSGIHLGQVAIERVGLHLDVFGRHMQRASSLARAASPGEILVSEPVAENAGAWPQTPGDFALDFAPRGRVMPPGTQQGIAAFAVITATKAGPPGPELPSAFIEVDTGGGRRVLFDASHDRRVVLGRSSTCDLRLATSAASRKHALLLFEGAQWLLIDLGSTNSTNHNGRLARDRQPLAVGDRIGVGEIEIVVTRMATARGDGGGGPRLRIDLAAGTACFADAHLPLSAAELVWFAYLARARCRDDDGWVIAGQEGHAAFRAFAEPLWTRPWSVGVRTRPLLDLVAGEAVDDDDLRNLRGKTVQKLKRFVVAHPAATSVVPESDGRKYQRLPIEPTSIEILE